MKLIKKKVDLAGIMSCRKYGCAMINKSMSKISCKDSILRHKIKDKARMAHCRDQTTVYDFNSFYLCARNCDSNLILHSVLLQCVSNLIIYRRFIFVRIIIVECSVSLFLSNIDDNITKKIKIKSKKVLHVSL